MLQTFSSLTPKLSSWSLKSMLSDCMCFQNPNPLDFDFLISAFGTWDVCVSMSRQCAWVFMCVKLLNVLFFLSLILVPCPLWRSGSGCCCPVLHVQGLRWSGWWWPSASFSDKLGRCGVELTAWCHVMCKPRGQTQLLSVLTAGWRGNNMTGSRILFWWLNMEEKKKNLYVD